MSTEGKLLLVVLFFVLAVALHLLCCEWKDVLNMPWSPQTGAVTFETSMRALARINNCILLAREKVDRTLAVGLGVVVPVMLVTQALGVMCLGSKKVVTDADGPSA